MRPKTTQAVWAIALAVLSLSSARSAFAQQLDENCTISVLNRNVRVRPDGSWVLPNVPANFGPVRARVTCIVDGQTISGESDPFLVPTNGVVNRPHIIFGHATPIPRSVSVTAPFATLTQLGGTAQLTVTARYPDGTSRDVTSGSGTQYTISNPAIATVSPDGLVQAVKSGTVVIQATLEGTSGITSIRIAPAGSDTDGDGIPDEYEVAHGLNPNNPVDAQEDPDHDGLTNLQEYLLGTDPHNADTDGDGLTDGQEVARGTSPLLWDTDGDGISDGLEVGIGTDPLDASSFNLAAALASIAVAPSSFVLSFNTIAGDATVRLTVRGTMLDGRPIDLTGRGVNFASSDLNVCNFGATQGEIFAGQSGTCTITATIATFSTTATGTVRSFSPTALSFVSIPGFANNVDISGDFAYVAAGSAGLQIVDVSNRLSPHIVASLALAGNANDVRLDGTRAYVAGGSAGLHIVDVSSPLSPHLLGSITLPAPGDAYDVRPQGNLVYVADGPAGLLIIDVSSPDHPRIAGSVRPPGIVAHGVDVNGQIAVVAAGFSGIQVFNVANPAAPVLLGSVGLPDETKDVVVNGKIAYVADYQGSLQTVDFSVPTAPRLVPPSTPIDADKSGYLMDVALAPPFVFGADVKFFNGVPISDVSTPSDPRWRTILDFRNLRDDDGTGIAVDGNYVYLTTNRGIQENGSFGDGRLYIGQYRALEDLKGVAPTVSIVSPAEGVSIVESESIPISVSATDDVAVVSVNFLVDGAVVFTDTSAPYQFSAATAGLGLGLHTLSATAVDLGSNVGVAADVHITVIDDPLTTVIGRVVDNAQQPLAGVTVSVLTRSATTALDGTFSITGVGTLKPVVIVNASFSGNGTTLTGHSNAAQPVRGGTTDVGDIAVTPTTFEANLGTRLPQCDFCDVVVPLPSTPTSFPTGFPIGGGTVQQIHVNNGYLWTNRGDEIDALCCPGLVTNAGDPLSGRYVNDTLPGRLVVTWYHMLTNGGGGVGDTTAQIILFADGRIQLGYQAVTLPGSADAAVWVSNARNNLQVDFSAGPISLPFPESVYENFNQGHPFDLAGGFVSFTPNAGGGYDILPVPDITAPVCSVTPVSGTVFLEGQRIQVVANATDNGSIAHVHFQSSTNDLDTDLTAAPYRVPFLVPVGATSITFNVTAFDGWGNTGMCSSTVSVVPDPLTTVVGRVIDPQGTPIAGVAVTALSHTTQTGPDGRFSIPGVPTLQPFVVVSAVLVLNGQTILGTSAPTAVVRGDTTNVGDIIATATTFETNLGTRLQRECDSCDVVVQLPFAFPIGDGAVQQVHVNDGYIWTDEGDEIDAICCPRFVTDTDNPLSGVYVNDTLPDRYAVTWYRMGHGSGGEDFAAAAAGGPGDGGGGAPLDPTQTITTQMVLFADGRIQLGYQEVAPLGFVDTGLFPSNGMDTISADFSAGPVSLPIPESVVENFNPFGHPFDLAGGFVVFAPNGGGGYDIQPVPDLIGPVCSVTPANGAVLFEGEPIQVVANATDNGGVTHVRFQSATNDLDVDLTLGPFQVPFLVPVGAGSITFNVTAFDGWGNMGACSSTVSVVPGPPPTATITSIAADAVLIAGATVPIAIDATNRVPVVSVDFAVNGVALSSDPEAPFEFLFTVPAGVNTLALSAVATDTVGKTGTSQPVSVAVTPDPLTTVQGRIVDKTAAPIAGADVVANVHGATVEVFNFDTTLTALPNLDGRTPDRTTIVSAINLRNPGGMFGADPFGLGTASSRALRITSTLQTIGASTYTFKLGVKAGGRLLVNGVTVVDLPDDTGQFQEGTGTINVSQDTLSIEIFTFDNGNPEVQLSYAVPGEDALEVVAPANLMPTVVPYRTTSQADGTFTIAVPTTLGAIRVTASKVIDGHNGKGHSDDVQPVPGGATDVGDIKLTAGGRIGYYDLSLNTGNSLQVAPIVAAGLQAVNVGDLNTADLSQFDVVYMQNPDNGGYSPAFRNNLAKIDAFISNGGTLVFHDRHVTTAASVLPGSPGTIVRDFSDGANINIVDNTTLVTNGPAGIIDNSSLDGGNYSSHGYIVATSIPAGARGILSQGDPNHLVLYSYTFGLGHVVYSTIPLDFYLGGGGGIFTNMQRYSANVAAYANDLR